jgi:hypothetical protein
MDKIKKNMLKLTIFLTVFVLVLGTILFLIEDSI